MSEVNFLRDGQIGDKVTCLRKGKGVICIIYPDDIYSVWVDFGKGVKESYTYSGIFCKGDVNPTLCWGHIDIPKLDQGKPPVRAPKPLVLTGQPVWAYVGDLPDSYLQKHKRLVVAQSDIGFLAMYEGENNTSSIDLMYWKYAWEIPEDEERR